MPPPPLPLLPRASSGSAPPAAAATAVPAAGAEPPSFLHLTAPQGHAQQPPPSQQQQAASAGEEVALAGMRNETGEYNCFLNVIIQCLWRCSEFRQQVTVGHCRFEGIQRLTGTTGVLTPVHLFDDPSAPLDVAPLLAGCPFRCCS